jgi:hypothetical protein
MKKENRYNPDFMAEIRTYLKEGSEYERAQTRLLNERREFVEPIAALLESPEVQELLKRTKRSITVLQEGKLREGRADYEVTVEYDSLCVRLKGKVERQYGLPTPTKDWMDAIPYGGRFMYRDEDFCPDQKVFMNHLEDRIRRLMK